MISFDIDTQKFKGNYEKVTINQPLITETLTFKKIFKRTNSIFNTILVGKNNMKYVKSLSRKKNKFSFSRWSFC